MSRGCYEETGRVEFKLLPVYITLSVHLCVQYYERDAVRRAGLFAKPRLLGKYGRVAPSILNLSSA